MGLRFVVVVALLALGCQSAASVGAICTRSADCSTPLVCRLGRCRVECTANRDCPVGTRCLLDSEGQGSCSVPVDDSCHPGECPAPTLCVEGQCRNLCGGSTICPDGSDCVSRPLGDVCVERAIDAGLDDAGTSDTGADAGPGVGVVDVCSGEGYLCAVTALPEGHVYCWGAAGSGMLGDAAAAMTGCRTTSLNEPCSYAPVLVARESDAQALAGATRVICGEARSCALVGTDVYCWGSNVSGTLGTDDPIPTPAHAVRVELPAAASALVGTRLHACAQVRTDWYCWGENGHGGDMDGRLGDPSFTGMFTTLPRLTPAFAGASTLGLSTWTTCALFDDHAACAGKNDFGQAGVAPIGGDVTTPTRLTLASGQIEIAAGDEVFCVLDATGTVRCWGNADGCALTRPPPITTMEMPAAITGTGSYRHLASGVEAQSFCATQSSDDAVVCWGRSNEGQAGTATSAVCTPTAILRDDGSPVTGERVTVGPASCAVTPQHELWCWGSNASGELGMPPSDQIQTRAVRVALEP